MQKDIAQSTPITPQTEKQESTFPSRPEARTIQTDHTPHQKFYAGYDQTKGLGKKHMRIKLHNQTNHGSKKTFQRVGYQN